MGQKESRSTIKQGWHQKFGKIQLISDPSFPQQVRIRAILPTEQSSAYGRWWVMVQRLSLSPISPYLILPLRADHERCNLCSSSEGRPGLKLQYGWFRCSLQQDVKGRREIAHHYPEYQLWYLMLVLLKVTAYFEEQESFLGNLHTSNVFLDDQGKVKLFTVFSAPREHENVQRIRASKYEDAFVAPEQLPLVEEMEGQGRDRDRRAGVDQCSVDLFNIGLILLSAALLKDCYFLYNRTTFTINHDKLAQYKEELTTAPSISKSLRNLIMQFLSTDPKTRGRPSQYLPFLLQHQAQITKLQDFNAQALLAVQGSPQVVSYIEKGSPNSRANRFLSVTKHSLRRDTKRSKETDTSIDQETLYYPWRVQRKLFGE